MAKFFGAMEDEHRAFILRQKIFFIATAAADARINLSPKSTDALRVLSETSIVYVDRTGSGNETAAHLRVDGRLTFMFCAFEGQPMILCLYGRGEVLPRSSSAYVRLLAAEYGGEEPVGARQMILMDVTSVQTSCGFAVPLFDFAGERRELDRWAQAKGEEGLDAYRREKNVRSIDGLPTGLLEHEGASI